jgi:hypothetical protein
MVKERRHREMHIKREQCVSLTRVKTPRDILWLRTRRLSMCALQALKVDLA